METVVLLNKETIGGGDEELGVLLTRSFLKTLPKLDVLPTAIILLNGGVKLATEGAPLVADLQALAERGVEILACGTCLDWYGLKDDLAVGAISNMHMIATRLTTAGRVVSPS